MSSRANTPFFLLVITYTPGGDSEPTTSPYTLLLQGEEVPFSLELTGQNNP